MARLMSIGVLGGTFDPPHYGHLIFAEHTLDKLELDRVLWVPAGDPPHKQGKPISPVTDRLGMVECAIATNDAFELSRVDIDRSGPHYSVDMVRAIKTQYRHTQIVFLIGADSLRDLAKWHKPSELVEQVTLAIMGRGPDAPNMRELEKEFPGIHTRLHFLDVPQIDISSEYIRQQISTHRTARYLLPDTVLEYIQSHKLYRPLSQE